jgi:hypothetical protein
MGYTINDSDNRYNGWANYATWRVNLEIFDGHDMLEYFADANGELDADELSDNLKEFAENVVSNFGENEGLAMDYARAFLADVNWREIAEHMLENSQA